MASYWGDRWGVLGGGLGGTIGGALAAGMFKQPTIEEYLEEETRKHVPEKGYLVRANRSEACHAYEVRVWWEKPGAALLGEECIVAMARVDYDVLLVHFKSRGRNEDWRLRLVRQLQRDFDARKEAGSLPNLARRDDHDALGV